MSRSQVGRGANGSGSIRKIERITNGKKYVYYQARYTSGYDPGTGKQIQRSICGKSKKEVMQKLRQVTTDIDSGTYTEPCDLTVGEWLDTWLTTYLQNVKPRTIESYEMNIRLHLKPGLGAVKLQVLNAPQVQNFYNELAKHHGKNPALSAKTIHCIHGILHKALKKAIQIGYIRNNPTEVCELPRKERKEITPMEPEQISEFLRRIRGHEFEDVYVVTMFTGLRRGEVAALTWDCVDFDTSTIYINKQLQKIVGHPREFELVSTKNGKARIVSVAPSVMGRLRRLQREQAIQRLKMGPEWHNTNFVFCNEVGNHFSPNTIYNEFKKIVIEMGLPKLRFHDLRHSYAVAALTAGDDIKTVQANLGHATATFTLDVYGHVTDQMRRASASRMETFYQSVSNG